jgi:hypothetical protein
LASCFLNTSAIEDPALNFQVSQNASPGVRARQGKSRTPGWHGAVVPGWTLNACVTGSVAARGLLTEVGGGSDASPASRLLRSVLRTSRAPRQDTHEFGPTFGTNSACSTTEMWFTCSGLRLWWNWQTRYFEVVVPQGVQVQVLLTAPTSLGRIRPSGSWMDSPPGCTNSEQASYRSRIEGRFCPRPSPLRPSGRFIPCASRASVTQPARSISLSSARGGPRFPGFQVQR